MSKSFTQPTFALNGISHSIPFRDFNILAITHYFLVMGLKYWHFLFAIVKYIHNMVSSKPSSPKTKLRGNKKWIKIIVM